MTLPMASRVLDFVRYNRMSITVECIVPFTALEARSDLS